jgi:4'-phosphopantetheinyl transferase
MISLSPQTRETPETSEERFSLMLAHFSVSEPRTQQQRSILCRVLDGRDLEGICPIDAAMLTLEERAQYHASLKNPKTLAMAVRTRAELRRMLGRETGLPPQRVPLYIDAHGKPRCSHPFAAGLEFSVSHTDDCAMIAMGEAAGIGVDVERVLEQEPTEENLDIVFDEEEFRLWAALPYQLRPRAFTQAWTIKEAALKAIGTGLDGSTHDVRVTFDPAGKARPVFPTPGWIFEEIKFCPHHVASFVAWLG